MSFFSKAKDKLDLSRSSSTRSKKSKEKKRLSGLRYESLNNSKESVNSIGSKKEKKKVEPKVEPLVPVVGEPVVSEPVVDVKDAVNEVAGELSEAAGEPSEPVSKGSEVNKGSEPVTGNAVTGNAVTASAVTASEPSEPVPVGKPTDTAPEPLVPQILSSPKPPTETTPLNPGIDLESQRPISILSSPRFSIFIIIVLLLLVAIVYFSYSDSNVVIKQSVKPSIDSINLLELNNEGVKVHLNCSILINYDNITNTFNRFFYKNLGLLAGTIIFIPKLPIEVQLNDLKSFNVTTPSVALDLNNHALTTLDFNSTIHLNDENLIRLLNDLMSKEEVLINLKTSFHTDIKKGWFRLKNIPVLVDQELVFNNNLNGSEVEVMEVEVDDRLGFRSMVKVPSVIDDIIRRNNSFNLQIKDCQGMLVPIAQFHYLNGSIDGQVLPFEDECGLVDGLLNSTSLYINSTVVNNHYPSWLLNIVNHVTFRLPKMEIPKIKFPSVEYALKEVVLENEETLKVVSNMTMDLPYEFDLQYNFSMAKGSAHYRNGLLSNAMEIVPGKTIELDHLNITSTILNTTLNDLGTFTIPNISIPSPNITINDIMVIDSTAKSLDLFVDVDISGISFNFTKPMEFMLDAGKMVIGPVTTLSLEKSPELVDFLNNVISNRSQDLTIVSPFNTITTTPNFNLQDLIVDVTMHVFRSEVELTVFNPISNHELDIMINSVDASYQGTKLGTIEKPHRVMVIPGESKTGKIPIKFNAVGVDILRKALNGLLLVDVVSEFTMDIDELSVDLQYEGHDLTANIRV